MRIYRPLSVFRAFMISWLTCVALVSAASGGLNPAELLKPLSDRGPHTRATTPGAVQCAHADQPGEREEPVARLVGRRLGSGPSGPRTVVGGEGTGEVTVGGATTVKGAILMVNDVLYVTAPDHVWALDARDGHELWRYFWKTKGGTHIGNRGAAMWGNYLFFVTPDDYFVSLDARTGKERWHKEAAPFSQQYFLTSAPMTIGNHIIVGTGNDLDSPGYLMSFDPETGEQQWRFYTVPMNPGDPGLDTWKSLDSARHGGGHPWLPGVYDPETKLYIFGTGNPTPAYTSKPRGEGLDNLFTCAIVAVNVDTGKMEWYYQTSPHDTHDWDSAQTPVLVDGMFGNSGPRKMVLTASRNGYYFTLDRHTGEHLVTSKFSETVNWAKGLNAKGPAGSRAREGSPHRRRARVGCKRRSDELAATGVQPRHGASTCRPRKPTPCTTSARPIRAAPWASGERTRSAWARWAVISPRSTTKRGRPFGATSSAQPGARGARRDCSPRRASCCSAAMSRAISSRSIRRMAGYCGTPR